MEMKEVGESSNNTCSYAAEEKGTEQKARRKLQCLDCNYSTGDVSNLNKHVRAVHQKIKSLQCPHCTFRASEKGNLTKHVKMVHTNERDHKCPHCDFASVLKLTMLHHVISVHERDKKVKCHLCEFSTVRESNLRQHVRGVHEKILDYRCDAVGCNFATYRPYLLSHHKLRSHGNNKPFSCQMCEYRTSKGSQLRNHVKVKHQTELKCRHCTGFSTRSRPELEGHIRQEHPDAFAFHCDNCDNFSCFDKESYVSHVRKHHPVGSKFECCFCQHMGHSNSKSFKKHVEKHEKEFQRVREWFEASRKGTEVIVIGEIVIEEEEVMFQLV